MAMQRKRRRRSGGNNNNNTNPNKHYESNGPDVRIRGSAQQILEKYLQYARDAQTSGDRVKAEGLFQHAEHYARIVAEFERIKEIEREQREQREQRDAARAEDRAQQEAERVARAEDLTEASAETGEADVTEDAPSLASPEACAEDAPERKPRRTRRKRSDMDMSAPAVPNAPNALSVIDADPDEQVEVSMRSEGGAQEETVPAEPKPKRRSYTRRVKDSSQVSLESEDGIMKTLSRGVDDATIVDAE